MKPLINYRFYLKNYVILFFILLIVTTINNAAFSAIPSTTVEIMPVPAYDDIVLYGSGDYFDFDGDPEGTSAYTWFINNDEILSGEIPQSILLPMNT